MTVEVAMLLSALFCFVVGGALIVSRRMKVKRCTATTDGVVSAIISKVNTYTDYEERDESLIRFGGYRDRTVAYTTLHPEFTYTVDGIEYVKQSNSGSTHCALKEGQAVTVLYCPDDPNIYHVKDEKAGAVLAWTFLIFGIALVGLWFYYPYM